MSSKLSMPTTEMSLAELAQLGAEASRLCYSVGVTVEEKTEARKVLRECTRLEEIAEEKEKEERERKDQEDRERKEREERERKEQEERERKEQEERERKEEEERERKDKEDREREEKEKEESERASAAATGTQATAVEGEGEGEGEGEEEDEIEDADVVEVKDKDKDKDKDKVSMRTGEVETLSERCDLCVRRGELCLRWIEESGDCCVGCKARRRSCSLKDRFRSLFGTERRQFSYTGTRSLPRAPEVEVLIGERKVGGKRKRSLPMMTAASYPGSRARDEDEEDDGRRRLRKRRVLVPDSDGEAEVQVLDKDKDKDLKALREEVRELRSSQKRMERMLVLVLDERLVKDEWAGRKEWRREVRSVLEWEEE